MGGVVLYFPYTSIGGHCRQMLSLGPAEPFGPHPNGLFHMIEKNPHKQKAGEESRGNCEEKTIHTVDAASSALKVLCWVISPRQRSMG